MKERGREKLVKKGGQETTLFSLLILINNNKSKNSYLKKGGGFELINKSKHRYSEVFVAAYGSSVHVEK